MNGIDFLSYAKSICKSTDEAARRSAVSRSYYALFHDVRQNFINMGIAVSNLPEEHRRLANCLKQSGIIEAMSVGQSMSDLRTARNQADYDLSLNLFNSNTSTLHCAKAEAAINQLAGVNKIVLLAALNGVTGCG